jgi:adenosylcobinamide-GDP ribazoletransferase
VVLACRRQPAAGGGGFGELVAQTQSRALVLGWIAVFALLSCAAAHSRLWSLQTPLAIVLPLLLALALARHCTRRLGGITGDTLGATVELSVAVCAVVGCLS